MMIYKFYLAQIAIQYFTSTYGVTEQPILIQFTNKSYFKNNQLYIALNPKIYVSSNAVNDSQLAKMKKYIPYMPVP